MKQYLTLFLLLSTAFSAQAQDFKHVPNDTLLIEQFIIDPTATMLPLPSGADMSWVNFDGDDFAPLCQENAITPGGWFFEGDFGQDDTLETNFCFTSCSYFDDEPTENLPCANWLILPPVEIPDSTCTLQWKSLSLQGPAFLDGYQVLVSVSGNDLFSGVFTDTLFSAASMIDCSNCGSVNLNSFTFTPGYIHANGYTNANYFTYNNAFLTNFGRLEPHEISLKKYAGKQIYIAFLHDSNNNYLLQLDDILVINEDGSSDTRQIGNIVHSFSISPNPASETTLMRWNLLQSADTQLEIRNATGQLISRIPVGDQARNQYLFDCAQLANGFYTVSIITADGMANQRFIKL